ncbi:MAG: ABC transporter ATP-binding protein [Chloroflexota bacterium]
MATFAFGSRRAVRDSDSSIGQLEQIAPLLWPSAQAHLALLALAKSAGWVDLQEAIGVEANESLVDIAQQWHINLDPICIPYSEVQLFSQNAQLALIHVEVDHLSGWLAFLKGGKRRVSVLAADSSVQQVSPQLLHFALCQHLEAPWEASIEQALSERSAPNRHTQVRQALLNRRLETAVIEPCWQLTRSAGVGWWAQAQEQRLPQMFGAATFLQGFLTILGYAVVLLIGLAAFNNVIEWSWILLACILLMLRIPLDVARLWITDVYNIALVVLVKRRLFHGILRLTPRETQEIGTGQLLAWGAVGTALNTIGNTFSPLFRSLFALSFVGIALAWIGSLWSLVVLVGWFLFAAIGGWWLFQLRFAYESYHAKMINGIMERMQGHQTRLMQENDWYGADDVAMTRYFELRRRFERFEAFYMEALPYVWLIGGLGTLAADFIDQSNEQIAIGFALVLFTKLETDWLANAVSELVEICTAWRLFKPLDQAANRPIYDGERDLDLLRPTTTEAGQQLVTLQNVAFSYPQSNVLVIKQASLQIEVGDRLLLEGPSGGGKSTLAYLLSGHYSPQKGLLFLWGLDKYTLGSARWRRWVVYAPQFHQNHIISASLGFNLLMGRNWPPHPQDLADAEAICRELGLGSLLERMPQGLDQRVGERGWYLSHGERSRVYIARALLQQADLVVLDESFASLDPETMAIALRTVLNHAPTLLVIAHP